MLDKHLLLPLCQIFEWTVQIRQTENPKLFCFVKWGKKTFLFLAVIKQFSSYKLFTDKKCNCGESVHFFDEIGFRWNGTGIKRNRNYPTLPLVKQVYRISEKTAPATKLSTPTMIMTATSASPSATPSTTTTRATAATTTMMTTSALATSPTTHEQYGRPQIQQHRWRRRHC